MSHQLSTAGPAAAPLTPGPGGPRRENGSSPSPILGRPQLPLRSPRRRGHPPPPLTLVLQVEEHQQERQRGAQAAGGGRGRHHLRRHPPHPAATVAASPGPTAPTSPGWVVGASDWPRRARTAPRGRRTWNRREAASQHSAGPGRAKGREVWGGVTPRPPRHESRAPPPMGLRGSLRACAGRQCGATALTELPSLDMAARER